MDDFFFPVLNSFYKNLGIVSCSNCLFFLQNIDMLMWFLLVADSAISQWIPRCFSTQYLI